MTLVNSRIQLEDFSSITGSPSASSGRVEVLERHGGIFKCGGGNGGSGDLGCFFGPTITTQSKKSWAQAVGQN